VYYIDDHGKLHDNENDGHLDVASFNDLNDWEINFIKLYCRNGRLRWDWDEKYFSSQGGGFLKIASELGWEEYWPAEQPRK
jgi:hypothetical protein